MREFFFLPCSTGPLCAMHWVGDAARTPVLLLPPLQEELNKSRRQMKLIADALQTAGHGVLLVDYYGTGDSAGDWQDATLSLWQQNVRSSLAWLAERYTETPHLLSLRAGCVTVPEDFTGALTLCFPILDGKTLVTQWLRQKLFASRLAGGNDTQASLSERWQSDGLELSGYFNSPMLYQELMAVDLRQRPHLGRRQIIELGAFEAPTPAIASFCQTINAGWQAIAGEAFWQASEIGTLPELPARVLEAVRA
ncbi:hypothetical protein [Permianibacter aggregans]|uniref:Exosortase A-associated hydrolase 2 n=1 Tax=Permianibacter aggregans TaxID=1510150 RepID=A0A4R6UTQ6_9GAMM|nr:hypothetical protein [Permianibacter aggregans]QGX40083.1 hypothetical protein E2H98_10550 [Permianibacter aggregans]TDQ49103.1 exosortase A-associated hydrolase 2 [Permianibacter aggregans]